MGDCSGDSDVDVVDAGDKDGERDDVRTDDVDDALRTLLVVVVVVVVASVAERLVRIARRSKDLLLSGVLNLCGEFEAAIAAAAAVLLLGSPERRGERRGELLLERCGVATGGGVGVDIGGEGDPGRGGVIERDPEYVEAVSQPNAGKNK